jgi:hypothetical protein
MMVPTLVELDRSMGDTIEEKAKVLAKMEFPPLVAYNGGGREEGLESMVLGYINNNNVM